MNPTIVQLDCRSRQWMRWLDEYADAHLGSPKSKAKYADVLGTFWRFVGHDDPGRTTGSELARWRGSMFAAGLAPATIRHRLTVVRAFLRWLHRRAYIAADITTDVKVPRGDSPEGDCLDERECQAILRSPDARTRWGRRDRSVLEMMAVQALRPDETCRLDLSDIGRRYGRRAIRVLGKGGNIEWVRLTERSEADLDSWLDVRPGPAAPHEPLYLTRPVRGGPARRLTYRALSHAVTKHRCRALIERPISPHDLRRTAASIAHAHGATLDELRRLLRHKSLAVTARYLSGLLARPAADLNPLGRKP